MIIVSSDLSMLNFPTTRTFLKWMGGYLVVFIPKPIRYKDIEVEGIIWIESQSILYCQDEMRDFPFHSWDPIWPDFGRVLKKMMP